VESTATEAAAVETASAAEASAVATTTSSACVGFNWRRSSDCRNGGNSDHQCSEHGSLPQKVCAPMMMITLRAEIYCVSRS
jgi:hypothetical protein